MTNNIQYNLTVTVDGEPYIVEFYTPDDINSAFVYRKMWSYSEWRWCLVAPTEKAYVFFDSDVQQAMNLIIKGD